MMRVSRMLRCRTNLVFLNLPGLPQFLWRPWLRAGDCPGLGRSGRHRKLLRWFASRIEQMAQSGFEHAIVGRAMNLNNGISATP